jgi:hypothetical protein
VPFFCGVVQHRSEGPFASAGWFWPLSRIEFRDSDLLAYTPVLFGRWTLTVPYAEIAQAALRRQRWGGRIRVHRSAGDVTLTAIGGNYGRIESLLRDSGVRVTGGDSRATETA